MSQNFKYPDAEPQPTYETFEDWYKDWCLEYPILALYASVGPLRKAYNAGRDRGEEISFNAGYKYRQLEEQK